MTQAASTITLSQLESHLWKSANILRGPVDAADFKTYIFPLLFFKRICDAWDEEYAETGDAELALFPKSHRVQIPDNCHWNGIRAVVTNVGNALQRIIREIEKANPDTLYGVFGDAQWTNKDRLSDALLKDQNEHFSRISFGNKNITSDVLDDAYEYLIKKFADATNKKAGEFYTCPTWSRSTVQHHSRHRAPRWRRNCWHWITTRRSCKSAVNASRRH
ncbi:type I restriction-modification system subunit M N-terminal domain-containing protein [uncultured Azonexus sp.]|uniref:type I restriction-modification system subunit M N-terminal domain-containing protein n=1 Tax=uncultured Azonexus sp. TaxID=520307 RepID=UPI00262EB9C1|nr:type I restriction-modification system subunit M N-terminal domain-containing protein [uncultured Azonexus sp.]